MNHPLRRGLTRRTRALGGSVVVAVVLSACGGGEAEEQNTTAAATESPQARLGKSFTSPSYRYTVRYPEAWSAVRAARSLARDELTSHSSDSVDKLSEDPRGTTRPALTIGAQDVARGTSVDDLRTETVRHIGDKAGCRPQAETGMSVAGEAATLLTYSSCATFDLLWTVVVHRRSGFHIVWWGERGKAAADRPQYDEILSTFAFKD